MSLIDPSLAEVLVCPVDRAELVEDEPAQRLQCTECGRRYPVRDGIPIMLVDEAEGGPDE
ncbi:MAG: Trm112 family protein [Acidimicrobiia bacterium]